ncbi:MAG: DJ-1/PfpI family protein [Candidatus Promineifilaceae bacterium]|nr:DJ-1/PfpI family protein [Candidatus Promineifilaceae bacterium]
MHSLHAPRPRRRSLVLVADGFQERTTVGCIHTLREVGAPASVVGLTAGPVTGSRGIVLQPDLSLDQVSLDDPPLLAVLPGGRRCIAALLTDPRVHRLLALIVGAGGSVALLHPAGEDLEQLLSVPVSRPEAQSLAKFITGLLRDFVEQVRTGEAHDGHVADG